MKRSEIVTLIEEEIILSYKVNKCNSLELSNRILNTLEKAGMLPPTWIPKDDGYVYSDKPSGEPNGFRIGVNKWEPENEKNRNGQNRR